MKIRWDSHKFVLIVNVRSTLIAIVTAIILARENSGSRNLALAAGTLAGGAVSFLIQLRFELSGRKKIRGNLDASIQIDRP
jgi:peptidoglycan biosynthesis protein MviN/MurJ (putative lipid II flippase)